MGSPFSYGLMTEVNTYCDSYELSVSLAEGTTLTAADGSAITGLSIPAAVDLASAIVPQLEGVDLSGIYTGTDGKVLTYGSYAPTDDGEKHPLVIWLHGTGEGGTDPSIALLGNEVTALFGEEFQDMLGSTYVLAPQTPQFWMVYNEKGKWKDNPSVDCVYLSTLQELIADYISNNPGIDTDRIYLGGCSNGGYMALDLILNDPDTYAAAYLISESYMDAGITDAQLERIQNVPIWFVYALNDKTVDPEKHEIPTVRRLQALGADVHTSVFDGVTDTSGQYSGKDGGAHEYNGHWSWIYFFNNECEEDGVSLWQWLAAQKKE